MGGPRSLARLLGGADAAARKGPAWSLRARRCGCGCGTSSVGKEGKGRRRDRIGWDGIGAPVAERRRQAGRVFAKEKKSFLYPVVVVDG